MFDAFAETSLDFDGESALDVSFLSDVSIDVASTGFGVPEAEAEIDKSDSFDEGLILATALGTTSGVGKADAAASAFSIFTFSNPTDATITSDLLFSYDFGTSVGVTDPAVEDAVSAATISLIGGDIDESFSAFADSAGGSADDGAFGDLLLSVTLAPGEALDLELSAFVAGGVSQVPLPAAVWLLLSATGLLTVFGRRR